MTEAPPKQAPEVLVSVKKNVGRITLNRPKALHALTLSMCETMIETLLAWQADPEIDMVMIDHSGERGFCAGGDIRMLAESGAGDGVEARKFFRTEYRLNHLLFHYDRPIVAIMDGVVMGGGVGISMPAHYRIATERTTFAMPETGIGLFPDVGGGWYLPRLPGKAGLWLALTGARIKGSDCMRLGIATHFVEFGAVEGLKKAILADHRRIDETLRKYRADAGKAPLVGFEQDLNRLFVGDSVEEIFEFLEADSCDWGKAQLAVLKTKSPQTLKVAFEQLKRGEAMTDFADNMAMEYRIGSRVVRKHDFIEGVRAVIVDKDNAPRWDPPSIEAVNDADIQAIFAPLPPEEEWTPLADA
ncbi:enoyl-CoA hydratase/isomerase family protein [Caulobacter endophyticus]|uniref:enoyl-CoA hydratase/isomerase family protein n=1 Tax=Caulobacter endophyticus TaxID=2172652 RepID=UPI00240F3C90|nr:enoyl-CoA hydratase/isomerase family protein [Caulobacter endophyticus]MDG2527987.1 enoyl-CoA hydratase/isomerase family protein [Caulobacter endophyticus]